MFGFLKSASHADLQLGELRRSRGAWRGQINLGTGAPVPLVVAGSRQAPDTAALGIAHAIASALPGWQPSIAAALLEHYRPYAEAVAAGEEEPPAAGLPTIEQADDVWPHVSVTHVAVMPLDGVLTTEIGYRTAWDEEHTLGARLRDGQLVELNGSVLAP